jgi:circadian clock protein KaiC
MMDLNFIERMPTGIPGLDDMIEGGLPIPSITLVAGDAGAGKTTMKSIEILKMCGTSHHLGRPGCDGRESPPSSEVG